MGDQEHRADAAEALGEEGQVAVKHETGENRGRTRA